MVFQYKGYGLSMGTMICGWDKTWLELYYIDSYGQPFNNKMFAVGSGAAYAFAVMDELYHLFLLVIEALELA